MIKPSEMLRQLNRMVFSIMLIGHRKCEPSWYHKSRTIRFHSLWCISKGNGEFIIDDTHYPAEPGRLFVFVPGMKCERKTYTDTPLEYYFIRFSYAAAYEVKENWYFEQAQDVHFPLEGMYTVQNSPTCINLFEQIHHLWKRRGNMVVMRRKILFQELLLTIVQDFRSQKVSGNTTVGIESSIDFMVNHYQEHITLDKLAQIAGLSSSHYSRLFKRYVGYSPIDYLTHIRMDRAKELLVLSDYRLRAVAHSVGYQDEFYFSRIFKKIEGISPSDYAKRHQAR